MLDIVIATGNIHKFKELKGLLKTTGVRWHSLKSFKKLPPVKENGRTFEANAIKKAVEIARGTGFFTVADDSGLEVDALRGAPGVYSARFAGRHGNDKANNEKLLRELAAIERVRTNSTRGAQYRCVLALASPKRLVAAVNGLWRGKITYEPKGKNGFGYDPIFMVPRFRQTVGQLPPRTKAQLSHRAIAAKKLQSKLRKLVG